MNGRRWSGSGHLDIPEWYRIRMTDTTPSRPRSCRENEPAFPTMTTPDWTAARGQIMLDPAVTMLNTGSFGPLPEPVFERVTAIRRLLAQGPTNFYVRQAPPLLWEARERTAAFLGT